MTFSISYIGFCGFCCLLRKPLIVAGLLPVSDSITVADLLFIIEDGQEKRRKVDEGTGTK
jgi:hypothetical protein